MKLFIILFLLFISTLSLNFRPITPLPLVRGQRSSFIESKSSLIEPNSNTKGGNTDSDTFSYVNNPPAWLPPPPEWGPLPSNMYSSYYRDNTGNPLTKLPTVQPMLADRYRYPVVPRYYNYYYTDSIRYPYVSLANPTRRIKG